MGRYKTSVASSTVVLIEDTPDIINQSIQQSIKHDTNIAEDVVNTIANAYGRKARRAYEYAKDHYYLGLPDGTLGQLAADKDKVLEVLKTFVEVPEGGRIDIISAQLFTINLTQFANEAFSKHPNHGYDYNSNTVHNVPVSGDGYFHYVSAPIVSTVYLTPYRIMCNFEYTYIDNNNQPIKLNGHLEVDIVNQQYNKLINNPSEHYYYIVYQVYDKDDNAVGDIQLWNYWENSNYYPSLNLDDKDLNTTQYMPIVPIRINNNTLFDSDGEKESNAYKTSKALLEILELDIDELTESVNANPDIGQVDHAYITLGVNLFSKKPESNLYLFEFIKYMHTAGNGAANTISISDGTYSTRLQWNNILFSSYEGNIGKVGTITKNVVLGFFDKFYIRKQINSHTIHEYVVYELRLYNYIYATNKAVVTSLSAIKESEGQIEALCFPINISLMEEALTPLEANTVYYDALRIVFNSFERTKLKWYQTGIFKFVTIVIAVAITVFTGGAGAALLIAVVAGVVINLALDLLLKIGVKLFGEHGGKIFATIAIVAAIAVGFVTGFVPDITSLLQVGLQLGSSLANKFNELDMEGISSDYASFKDEAKEKQDILEEAQNKLDKKNQLDPLGIYESVGMIPNQSIDQYFYTKLELPLTAGRQSLDMLYSWVDNQLTLPKFN